MALVDSLGPQRPSRIALASSALGLLLFASPARAQSDQPWRRSHWLFGLDFAYGARAEADSLATREYRSEGTSRADVLATPSIGFDFGRELSSGLIVLGTLRVPPLVVAGQFAVGAGAGYIAPLGRGGLWLFALARVGYASIVHPFDERGVEYAGPWSRAEVGVRYRLLQSIHSSGADTRANGFSRRLTGDFDLYFSFALALDVVCARYPEVEQARVPADHGWRLGPDASLGVGFLF